MQDMDVDPDNFYDEAGALDASDDETFGSKPRKRKKKKIISDAEQEAHDNSTTSNLSAEDPKNFLKLCLALQILTARRITEDDLQRADRLLREYCQELVEVRRLLRDLMKSMLITFDSFMVQLSFVPTTTTACILRTLCAIMDRYMNSGLSSLNASIKPSRVTRPVTTPVVSWKHHFFENSIGLSKNHEL